MRTVTIWYNGFHGYTRLRFRSETPDADDHVVSERVARRLNAEVCGMKDCLCRNSVAYRDRYRFGDNEWHVLAKDGETIRGPYASGI